MNEETIICLLSCLLDHYRELKVIENSDLTLPNTVILIKEQITSIYEEIEDYFVRPHNREEDTKIIKEILERLYNYDAHDIYNLLRRTL